MKTVQAGLLILSLVGTLNATDVAPESRWLQAEDIEDFENNDMVNVTSANDEEDM